MAEIFLNPKRIKNFRTAAPTRLPLEFHRRFPAYKPTPLILLPKFAKRFGVAELSIKDESHRLGLPSFKILGASWAIYQVLLEKLRTTGTKSISFSDLTAIIGRKHSLKLICATDGNHGKAVARVGRLLGIPVRVHVPEGTAEERMDAIEVDGARVIMNGSYDEAVARAAKEARAGALLIQDTAWDGYEQIPAWTVEGYSTLLWEMDKQMKSSAAPTHVFVQMGVGSLAKAVVQHYRRKELKKRPVIIGIEPERAACVLQSMKSGRIVHLKGRQHSVMAGLNAGTMSSISFDTLKKGIDCFVAINDERAKEAVKMLAEEGLVSGETGAAGLAGFLELMTEKKNSEQATRLGLGGSSRVLLISTEGATDPQLYEEIVGHKPSS